MLAIIDYGVGNLYSLRCSLRYLGAACEVTDDPEKIAAASGVLLPGVGAFGDAMQKLCSKELDGVVRACAQSGRPLLGICLGMQLLYEESCEYGVHTGLGLVPGQVRKIEAPGHTLRVPHIGWNSLRLCGESPLLRYVPQGAHVYYVHSYYAPVSSYSVASSQYGPVEVTGLVQNGNVFGTQFHPEKSGDVGLRILGAFAELAGAL